ncbi:MAG: chromosomal replication initiator DnaA [Rhizobiaceae bacterium]|jgi:chromosomal replication initiation ATPase DnaA|nr:chromosomal replication initiator DnaA [Rhizobiaceae bacterium]
MQGQSRVAAVELAAEPDGRMGEWSAAWIEAASPERRAEMCEAVIDLSAALFNVDSKALRRATRCDQDTARVRQIAMYFCNTTLGISLTLIGKVFSRDRTTVGHAVQLIELLRDDRDFDAIMEQGEKVIRAAFFRSTGHGARNDAA